MRGKIAASQFERRAYVYVRQSTATQVFEHRESTQRQYALVDRAVALGWSRQAVEVIDEDQGMSGASAQGRSGFARLAHAVAHGHAGAVLALEVSRLARSSEDWQRLLSLCAVAQVPVIDEQTIYDPGDKDDKLLLDLKGTMSEAELHWLSLRLAGGRRNKAQRGELRFRPATGYVWTERGLALDPDEAVQQVVRSIFDRYAIEPSGWAVVRWARETGLKIPTRSFYSDGTSELEWKPLGVSRLHDLLRNPVFAGVYVFGRRRAKKTLVNGEIRLVTDGGRDPEQWPVRLFDAHPAYISWETYLSNQEKLRQGRPGRGAQGAPREGASLLCGIILCGRCGRRMATRYQGAGGQRWYYLCLGNRDTAQTMCWSVPGPPVDSAVESLFLQTIVPGELELSLAVDQQVAHQAEELSRQWRVRIEQAAYEARRAERRYKAVDPENRVVARTLEREWEQRLGELDELERKYEEAKGHKRVELTDEDRARIRTLAQNLPVVWRASTTEPAERKAMLRLAIEAVLLSPIEVPRRMTQLRVQWQTGAISDFQLPRPGRGENRRTSVEAVERMRQLAADGETDKSIAERLNFEGFSTGTGLRWDACRVSNMRRHTQMKSSAPAEEKSD